MEQFTTYCKNYIAEHLGEYEGQMVYASDLGFTVTEGPNYDGTLTYSSYQAKEYLRAWWDECGEYWEYEKDNFGQNMHNPFDEPEAFMVCMVIEGVRSLIDSALSDIDGIDWDGKIELTTDLIEQIIERVYNNTNENLF